MKPKIIVLGIVLTGIVAACGVNDSNSHKFDPSKINGRWFYADNWSVRVDPETHNGFDHIHVGVANEVQVDYPYIYACQVGPYRFSGEPFKESGNFLQEKEDVKINHTKGNYYKVLKINGDHVNGSVLKIKQDTSGRGTPLVITKIKNGREKEQMRTGLTLGPSTVLDHLDSCKKSATYSDSVLF